jgi:serine protease Do
MFPQVEGSQVARLLGCRARCGWVALLLIIVCGRHSSSAEDVSPAEREQLYRELADEVSALERQGNLLRKAVRLAKPTVVHLEARRVRERDREYRSTRAVEEAGSGVVIEIAAQSYVLTNRHVVNDAPLQSIDIRFADGRQLHPKNLWADELTDVAVLEIEGTEVVAARLGNSDTIEIGDFVLAVGSPFGLRQTVTYGIISAKGRRDLDLGDGRIRYQDFLQTDAAINPGNSGGPLLNLRGEVIGINTAIASSSGGSEGIGFTIPINMAMTVARQLVEQGRPLRAYLGVNLNPRFGLPDAARLGLPRPRGAHVSAVTSGSPAARAMLRTDDVIVEFDGQPIEDDHHLIQVVGFTPIGREVKLVVFRQGRLITLSVVVEDRSQFEQD